MKALGTLGAVAIGIMVIAACKKEEETPPPQGQYQGGYQQQPGQYPQGQGQYPQGQGQYPQGQYPQPAPSGASPTPPAPAPAGQMAQPGPLAFPCQNDSACGLAKCNVQFQKCAFPCQHSQNDCAQGAQCNTATGFCLPGQ